jgi:hypothetical protein
MPCPRLRRTEHEVGDRHRTGGGLVQPDRELAGASLIMNVMFPATTSTVARTKSGRFVNCGYVVFRTVCVSNWGFSRRIQNSATLLGARRLSYADLT